MISNTIQLIQNLFIKIIDIGFFPLLISRFIVQLSSFITVLLIAKFLGPVELGEINILQSYISVFILISGVGLNSAVFKYCSEERSIEKNYGILRKSIRGSIITAFIGVILYVLLIYIGVISSYTRLFNWSILFAIVIPFGVLIELLISYLQSQKLNLQLAKTQISYKIFTFALIVPSTILGGIKGFILSMVFSYFIGVVQFLRQVGLQFLKFNIIHFPQGFIQFALFSVVVNGINVVGRYGDIFILDHFSLNRAEIGYYSLASKFVLAASQVTYTVQIIVAPYFSQRAVNKVWLKKNVTMTQTLTTIMSIILALIIFTIGWFIIEYFFFQSYVSTLEYLAVLLIRYIIISSCAIIGIAIFATGYVRYNLIVASISTFFSLLLSYVLLLRFDVMGVAWAQVISAIIFLVLTFFFGKIILLKN